MVIVVSRFVRSIYSSKSFIFILILNWTSMWHLRGNYLSGLSNRRRCEYSTFWISGGVEITYSIFILFKTNHASSVVKICILRYVKAIFRSADTIVSKSQKVRYLRNIEVNFMLIDVFLSQNSNSFKAFYELLVIMEIACKISFQNGNMDDVVIVSFVYLVEFIHMYMHTSNVHINEIVYLLHESMSNINSFIFIHFCLFLLLQFSFKFQAQNWNHWKSTQHSWKDAFIFNVNLRRKRDFMSRKAEIKLNKTMWIF